MVLLKEQLLLLELCVSEDSRRAVHESVRRNASAPRIGAERHLPILELTCGHQIRFTQPRRPPTWRAKDVGGNRPPRTPMGTERLFGSAGSGGCAKSRSRRHTYTTILPSFGPHWCVKPYCCLSG